MTKASHRNTPTDITLDSNIHSLKFYQNVLTAVCIDIFQN